eukprot:c7711_g1_i2.p1 GENE.c7711_g1_i2~~c7711_g1_i2.p1  ORF type:complete len:109 (-),score=13.61 c7711_g1_i2:77-379(-)
MNRLRNCQRNKFPAILCKIMCVVKSKKYKTKQNAIVISQISVNKEGLIKSNQIATKKSKENCWTIEVTGTFPFHSDMYTTHIHCHIQIQIHTYIQTQIHT